MKTLGKITATLLFATAGTIHAETARLTGMTPEEAMRRLLGIDEVDCHRVKSYPAQQECFIAQQKFRAGQAAILQSEFTCERYNPSPQDHLHITVQDAVQEKNEEQTYLYLQITKDSRQKELPEVFVGDTLPKTFAAQMEDGSIKCLGDGKWLEEKKRVASGESYRVRMSVTAAGDASVIGLVCLTE